MVHSSSIFLANCTFNQSRYSLLMHVSSCLGLNNILPYITAFELAFAWNFFINPCILIFLLRLILNVFPMNMPETRSYTRVTPRLGGLPNRRVPSPLGSSLPLSLGHLLASHLCSPPEVLTMTIMTSSSTFQTLSLSLIPLTSLFFCITFSETHTITFLGSIINLVFLHSTIQPF